MHEINEKINVLSKSIISKLNIIKKAFEISDVNTQNELNQLSNNLTEQSLYLKTLENITNTEYSSNKKAINQVLSNIEIMVNDTDKYLKSKHFN
tara:strand:- start:3919 stop:4200 length:282 start_codon:yes stop_codon:yes gene_type:complete